MKKVLLSVFCILFSLSAFSKTTQDNIRISKLLNFEWKFHLGDLENAHEVSFRDSDWRILDLPHDFQIEQPWNEEASPARGFKDMNIGWYRKTFKADPSWKGKKVLIDFEGIMLVGDVWLNGKKIGGTDYGYLGFESDISNVINYEGDNVLAVRSSTGEVNNSRWYTGGGLYRDVHIIVKDTISIARHGVYITTPKILNESADVDIQVEVEGLRGRTLDVEIKAEIFDPSGNKIAETSALAPKRNKLRSMEVPLPSAIVSSPQLWSCETPNLYTAEVTLIYEGKTIDKVVETFGIRTIEFSKEFGFKLNGEKVFLKGISNHHDLGAVGIAAYERAIERQFELLKKFGYNHVRLSHNPYSKSFLQLADKHGIIIVNELFDKWSTQYAGGRLSWQELWPTAITEWVKRDRNHPSNILWSLGNELQVQEGWAGLQTRDWGVTSYKILDVLVKRYDDTRLTTVGMFPARRGSLTRNDKYFDIDILPPELTDVTEIASFNYRYYNYPQYLEYSPDLIIYQSEATTNELLAPYFGMNYDTMVGLAYWGAIEYWGESHGWPRKGWNFSFFNHALEPYPQAYLIKSAFKDESLVHIGVVDSEKEDIEWNDITVGHIPLSSHWNRAIGSNQKIFTFTNAEEVELFVNGVSHGVQKNNFDDIKRRNIIYWQNIPYGKGGNIVAVARNNGIEVARHRLETTGKAVSLRMVVETSDWKADGMDLQYIKVYAVDRKGRVVPDLNGEVSFDVTGEAKLIAVDNGDHTSNDLFDGNSCNLHNGFGMAILRSNLTPGDVRIKASVKGLRSIVTKTNTK